MIEGDRLIDFDIEGCHTVGFKLLSYMVIPECNDKVDAYITRMCNDRRT